MKTVSINTASGHTLQAHLFTPVCSNEKFLLINSATGVKQQLYFSFAQYMCAAGYTVLTYDYEGIGLSKNLPIKNSTASMRSWGTVDYSEVTDFIKTHYGSYRKFVMGHSVGALILGFNADTSIFEKLIFVNTQNAYFGHLPIKISVAALLVFGFALPACMAFKGYFPAHFFGLGEALSRGVARDWQTLILNKKSTAKLYESVDPDYSKNITQPVFIIHAEDDAWLTMKGMEGLMDNVYPNAEKSYREIKISESPRKEIGHVNFFRSFNQPLWDIVLQELER